MNRNDVGWSDFIIAKMKEANPSFVVSEGSREFPNKDGLRWAARNYLGQIQSVPNPSPVVALSNGVACQYVIKCTLKPEVVESEGLSDNIEYHKGDADCTIENYGGNIYMTAYADTRAESRALVRFLNLNICSAEEFSRNNPPSPEAPPVAREDLKMHNILITKLGINKDKFYDVVGKELCGKKFSLSTMTTAQAEKLAEKLNEYQQGRPVPKSIL